MSPSHRFLPGEQVGFGTDYETRIADICAEFLQSVPPPRHASFQELGIHSLLLTRLANLLSDKLAIRVTVKAILTHQNIISLAHWCENEANVGTSLVTTHNPIIPAAPDIFPLSSSQQLMWFTQQIHPESPIYNIPLVIDFNRRIDADEVRQALAHLWQRHAMLRVKFHENTTSGIADVSQQVFWVSPPDLQQWDLSACSPKTCETNLRKFIERPFDLQRECAMRTALIRTPEQHDTLVLTVHHLVCDGWSIGLLHRDLLESLREPQAMHRAAEPDDAAIYYHFIQRSLAEKDTPTKAENLSWWCQRLQGLPTLPFPTDYPRPAFQSSAGDVLTWHFTTQQSMQLRTLAKRYNASLFQVLLSVFIILLQHYSQSPSVCVGISSSGRNDRHYEQCIGLFINTLVLSTEVDNDDNFSDVLHKVKTHLFAAMEHEVPFEELLRAINPLHDTTRHPLFQIMFDYHYENIYKQQAITSDLSCLSQPRQTRSAKFDLSLDIYEANEITLILEYSTALFSRQSMTRFIQHFIDITDACLQAPDVLLTNMALFSHYSVLNENNAMIDPSPVFKPMLSSFYQCVDQHGECVAVEDGKRQLSYKQLDDYSSHLAQKLIQAGIGYEDIVAIHLTRSLEYVIAVIAVLKSNAAFMPLDPAQPRERLATIAHTSKAIAICTSAALSTNTAHVIFHFKPHQIFNVDLDHRVWQTAPRPMVEVHSQQLAYVFYTSGSTGTPKGVMLSHAGLSNQLQIKVDEFALVLGDGIGYTATPGFDVSVWQTLTALICGGRTVIFPDITAWAPPALLQHCRRMEVVCIETVPSHFNQLLNYLELHDTLLPLLRVVMLNGEPLLAGHCRRWLKRYPHIPIVNGYGATEVSDDCSHYIVATDTAIPQHKPMPVNGTLFGYHIYVLDHMLNVVPPGAVGEICIAGIGIARGYLHDPVKTASQFVPNPYSKSAGALLYRSGDMAYYDVSGQIYYLGRKDNQLKINGVRVELAEIDAALRSLPQVEHSFTCISDVNQDRKELISFIIPIAEEKNGLTVNTLRPLLTQKLPVHIIPKYIIQVEEFPLKTNGKIDKNALLSLTDVTSLTAAPVGRFPDDLLETLLIAMWNEILEKPVIYTDQNFFEVGGHSMSGIAILTRLKKQFTVNISLKEFYQNATVASLAHYVRIRLNKNNEESSFGQDSSDNISYSIDI
ncbi:non-ribosomal peptide synthetase [Xenorhabdus bovienii]|uniref:non-ribosomal peptide synthetase n=1 Tax=Xenorhabdus bovienii TaxID=40576 RepID=UPI0023B33A7D|nr:amino acid adenylation domain-containing protein [Xenorhabdus bovienii]MDE9467191.1 amino acid adenylation domain-containing protein [Xenorhabdus bovienii]